MKTKMGRPSHKPAFLNAIKTTPVGEVVVMGRQPNDEPFPSYQAAQHHQKTLLPLLPKTAGPEAVQILRQPKVREDDNGKLVDGFYLVLKGRARQRVAA